MMRFETTRWSVIRAAASEQPLKARLALETLCTTYWYPLYSYIRRRGYSMEDAKDLTQEFFARFIEKEYLKDVDASKGKFRSFLLASVNHFLSNERDRANALKRGGGISVIPFDFVAAEERLVCVHGRELSPEKLYDRAWAMALLESVLTRLRNEYTESGKAALFNRLKGTLTGEGGHLAYRELGVELGLSEGAVKVAVHRLRHRYRDFLLEEISQTLDEGESLEEELQYLFSAIGS